MTKEYGCKVAISDAVGEIAGVELSELPLREVRVRGREAPLAVRAMTDLERAPI